ncbi:hypothetical protein CJD36_017150 [Flavipsychrobacter stenotrophus]|uniref:Uncharacterized protein n=1 Tax=Flavipsychrobacter stenotrophus TaxID=2077091 RepID=A0A2S7SRX3_9BACT|nr:hypothetical protein [Flavipsychrobacter stenotrophus]PQJ09662.1 hypothetical protein CJD36_017150 [Flavipsychrobacter stenotrophus]
MNTGKLLLLLLTLLSSSLISTAQYKVLQPFSKAQQDSLKMEIDIMVANDQKYRWMLMYGETDGQKLKVLRSMSKQDQSVRMQQARANKVGITQAVKDSLWKLQVHIDSENFSRLSSILYKYGVPHSIMPGHVSIILDHTPDMITDGLLALLKQEVQDKHFPRFEYAVIYDGLQNYRKLPELYHVTKYYSTTTKTAAIKQPEDLEATNKARKEIGLKRLKKQ